MNELSENTLKSLKIIEPNKLLILKQLYRCREDVCGLDLARDVGISKHLLSYHIKQLKELGVIEDARCGKRKNYKIVDLEVEKVKSILKALEVIN
ncbi:winged helix-turn-helix transcriptional regulator [Candidatus Dojkabacteria bacterium]|uniref:Winged helix-turn-helix transcriptional regulator n=1 Tax=Candidatus Dojkabacteria bacterium TaxID=2099670 RepID=A0A955L3D4_9BACT|nr:winged helix-turn-helix transcriptional regulator [Candidatus Dojkabacteria bacterium]